MTLPYNAMRKTLYKERKLMVLVFLCLIIRLFSSNSHVVENYYSLGIYPYLARSLRFLFGWIPFSLGDIFYVSFFFWVLYRLLVYFTKRKFQNWDKLLAWAKVKKLLNFILTLYIIFNLFWGLNYNRLGISPQLQLKVLPYSTQDLTLLAGLLQLRINEAGQRVDSLQRSRSNKSASLIKEATSAYQKARDSFPFLKYQYVSVKPSMISHIGQYLGFTGYYNPFTGEAQLKTTVPVFLKPFILTHEIAHQLGYAKENEANFVAYLACKNDLDNQTRYSAYFEMNLYALADLRTRDSSLVKKLKLNWNSRVRNDYADLIHYFKETENPIEPIIMGAYDQFLKMNNQPKGNKSYNEVIAWLIAYMKKYGPGAV
ncbi:MAG: DUF3810 domain-containing protein [Flavisolibacter sp.]